MTEGTKVIGYVRVSTQEQGRSGAGLEAQRRTIRAECERRGWNLLRIEEDVASARKTNGRPGLQRALNVCASGEAEGVIAAKLDRITRSLLDFARLVEDARNAGYRIVIIDEAFDLGTPNGRAMAGMLAVFAQWEREIIGQRIAEALAVKRAQGVRIGRPPTLPAKVRQRIRRLHRAGHGYSAIARRLEAEGVPTAHGGRWHASTIRKILKT